MVAEIYWHGVTYENVLDTLPVDVTSVTAVSNGLNFGIVESFITRAAGIVNAQLVRHGMSPDSLDANTTQIVQDALITYSAAFCLERLGASPDQIERRLREWKSILDMLKSEPQSLGSAQDGSEQLLVKSNVLTGRLSYQSKWRTGSYRY